MSDKPLGHKSYTSIPHLPSSQAHGDKYINKGQQEILTNNQSMKQKQYDQVVIQYKYDGSNVSIAKEDGVLKPLTRAGYHVESSPYKMHHLFADWINHRYYEFDEILSEGERICGEWIIQAHGTKYDIDNQNKLFRPFDIMYDRYNRLINSEFKKRLEDYNKIYPVETIYKEPKSVSEIKNKVGEHEGFVWRAEKNGKVNFLAKWVRPDFEPGQYLDREKPVWNYDPTKLDENKVSEYFNL